MRRMFGTVALVLAALAQIHPAAAQARGGRRCPSPAELAEAARSFGTGDDNERRAYAFFLQRYGRPDAFNQTGTAADMTYGRVRIALERDTATGLVQIRCRDGS